MSLLIEVKPVVFSQFDGPEKVPETVVNQERCPEKVPGTAVNQERFLAPFLPRVVSCGRSVIPSRDREATKSARSVRASSGSRMRSSTFSEQSPIQPCDECILIFGAVRPPVSFVRFDDQFDVRARGLERPGQTLGLL
jgi:hypothetical protein